VDAKYPFDGVDFANVPGALKFIITECIDKNTGVTDCHRKNDVSSIMFVKVTFQQPEAALWYFSDQNPGSNSSNNGMGPYLTFDSGTCAGQETNAISLLVTRTLLLWVRMLDGKTIPPMCVIQQRTQLGGVFLALVP